MDQPLRIVVTLLLFPVGIYLCLFPPRMATALWRALVHTPIDVDRLQRAIRKRTLRPDPFGDEALDVWSPTPCEQLMTRTVRTGKSRHADKPLTASETPSLQLLLRALPPELVLEILNFAEYYTPVSVVSDARKSVANGSLRYLSAHPLPHAGRLEEVRIALRGRDQGWSSSPELHGA
jgi:hypothetical protein